MSLPFFYHEKLLVERGEGRPRSVHYTQNERTKVQSRAFFSLLTRSRAEQSSEHLGEAFLDSLQAIIVNELYELSAKAPSQKKYDIPQVVPRRTVGG